MSEISNLIRNNTTDADTADVHQWHHNQIKHIKKFEQGKQGVTGLVKYKGRKCVYKFSQFMNFLTEHEYNIMSALKDISAWCPNFCDVYEMVECDINPNFIDANVNPFEPHERSVKMNVVFLEYIENSISLYDLIVDTSIPFNIIFSVIKQVLLAVIIAQKYKKFVHYDLHAVNILIRRCDTDVVNTYVLEDDNIFYIPTWGYIPVIIDYGFGSVDDLSTENKYLSCSLAYTESGYMSPSFDMLADAKILLISIADDLKDFRRDINGTYDPEIYKYRNIVNNIFKELPLDMRSGWDLNENNNSIIDNLFDYIENVDEISPLFIKYPHYCMDILQGLVQLPLRPITELNIKDLRLTWSVIIKEFIKIEDEINNIFYSLYVFQKMIISAREVKDLYFNEVETGTGMTDDAGVRKATEQFKSGMFIHIRTIAKFVQLKKVNFELLLCALYAFEEQLETQLYFMLQDAMKIKFGMYQECLKVSSTEHIYAILDFNFSETSKDEGTSEEGARSGIVKYVFNKKTRVNIYDCVEKNKVKGFKIPSKYVESVNNIFGIFKGSYIHKLYKETTKN
jgi:hypothetical protein